MKKHNVKKCAIEVSSHSLEQGRLNTIDFDVAVFTNLTREHLDYHKSMENYFAAKMKLFGKIKKSGYAIVNNDDPYSDRMIEKIKADKNIDLITYGIKNPSDIKAEDIKFSMKGLEFRLRVENDSIVIGSCLIGRHNVYNILASIGVCLLEV